LQKKFLVQSSLFGVILCAIVAIGLILPTTPSAKTSLYFAEIQKDSLLRNVPAPRMIFVGGSSVAMGLNGRILKDSLHINPINTALDFGLGLQYMLKHTLPLVKGSDIVILMPEYQHFTRDFNHGTIRLWLMTDVNRANFKLFNIQQIYNAMPSLFRYIYSTKLKPSSFDVQLD
jgi:hypothetical protein